jgi:hypothetical protein
MNTIPQRVARRAYTLFRRPFEIPSLTSFFGTLLILTAFGLTARAGSVTLAWNPSTNSDVAGYTVYYGEASGDYSSSVDAGPNLSATITGLTPGVTYYFVALAYDANGDESPFSNEITDRLPILPSIVTQPAAQTAVAGAPVMLAVTACGDPPLSFQWLDGISPIPGATASVLSWPQIGNANAGAYAVIVTNPWGSITSRVAMLTVIEIGFPSILVQPQSQTVMASNAVSFSCVAIGAAPLSMQWYVGTTAIPGATSSTLTLASAGASNAGGYYVKVSNGGGAVSSAIATLTVLAPSPISTVAGVYNGLFFQTNANGTPAITEATAGLLGNCVVAANGAFSAKIYVGGASCSLAGVFNSAGTATATVPRTGAGLGSLTAVLNLDLLNGTKQITGAISSTTAGAAWTSPLLGDLATNAYSQLIGAKFLMSPGLSANSPTNYGAALGLITNSVLSLSGTLGDTTAIAQTAPISKDGNVPVYVNLYNNGGLLEGWLNLAGGAVTGNLTWIRPSGALAPGGFPAGFDTVVQAAGTTASAGNNITNGLVLWYRFEDGAGTSAADASGNGYTGALEGNPQPAWGAGAFGEDLALNGSGGYVVSPRIALTNNFTVCCWVNMASGNGGYARIIETDYDAQYYLGLDSTGTKFQWIVNNDAIFRNVTSGPFTPALWYFVAATYNGTTGVLYVNGSSVSSGAFSPPGAVALPVYIGESDRGGSYYLNGALHDVRVYNRTLSPSEIATLFNWIGP